MTRREFLYAVGGATGAITGWVLIPAGKRLEASPRPASPRHCPSLATDVGTRVTDDGGELTRRDDRGRERVVCRVNSHGWRVVEGLDGSRTVQELARDLRSGSGSGGRPETEVAVASFLAMLAQAELLAEPFFVEIHAVEIAS